VQDTKQVAVLKEAVELSLLRYQGGRASYLDVLDAELYPRRMPLPKHSGTSSPRSLRSTRHWEAVGSLAMPNGMSPTILQAATGWTVGAHPFRTTLWPQTPSVRNWPGRSRRQAPLRRAELDVETAWRPPAACV